MKVKAINLYTYKEPFKSPISTPKVKLTHRESLFTEIVTYSGEIYYGECNAFLTHWYDKETILTVANRLRKWIPQVLHQDMISFDSWLPYLNQMNDAPAARSMVVMAVYQMYNDLHDFEVQYGATVSGLTNSQIETLLETRPKRIKLKWSTSLIKDLETIRLLNFDCDIAIDANESLTKPSFLQLANEKTSDIIYIEEPFKILEDLNDIDMSIFPRIAIDEKALSIEKIQSIIQQYPIQVVVLKPFRLGGIDRMLDAMKIFTEKNIRFVVGGMYEFGLSRYFTAMLAKEGNYPGDITPHGYYFANDIVETSGILKEGMIYFTPPKVKRSLLNKV